MKIHCIQHVPFESPGAISDWAKERGWPEFTYTRIFRKDPFPDPQSFDILLVMGGPMGVYDEDFLPWLCEEKAFLKTCIGAAKPVLGICLGAQLLANALGARVYPGGTKEIGWFPISLTTGGQFSPLLRSFPREFTPLHWHGDTFDLPRGAELLASSKVYANQLFSYETRCLGVQFHLEIRPQDAALMIEEFASEFTDGPYIQSPEALLNQSAAFNTSHQLLFTLLDNWAREL